MAFEKLGGAGLQGFGGGGKARFGEQFKADLQGAGLDPATATIAKIREAGIKGPGGVEFGSRLEKHGIKLTPDMTLADLQEALKGLSGGDELADNQLGAA